MIVARQSTARTMMVGPVLDADGVAVTTAVVGNFKISKNGGAPAALDASATLTHRNTGQYSLALTANDLDTVGQAEVVIDATVNASPIKEISVLEEAVYDSIFAAGATGYQVPIWSSAGATVNLSATTIAAVSGAVGSVTGAVGSVTGAVGSVTGNVGGNVVGSVASVTGNVGGNVTGSVGSVATGGITAASIATGAIDADALATDAISEIADGVWDEPLAAHTTADTPGSVLNMLTQDTVTLSTDVALNSIMGQLLDAGTTWTYDRTTDSLEANRDNTGTAGAGLTAIDLPDQTMNITGNLSGSVGSVTGAVGSVTAGVTVTTNNDKTGYSLTATTGLGNQTANITGNLSGSVGSVTGAVGSVTGAVGSVTGNIGGNVVGTVASIVDPGNVWDVTLASHLTAGSTGFALNAAGSAGDPWGTALPGAYGAGTAGFIIGNLNDITAADVWASATRTLTAGTNIGTVQAQLIDGAHGGAATVFTFERMIGLATTLNAHCVDLTGNGTGDGLHLQGGVDGDGLHAQGGTTSGRGIHGSATASAGILGTSSGTASSGIMASASGTGARGILATASGTGSIGFSIGGAGSDIFLSNSNATTLRDAILTAGAISATVAPNLDAAVSSRMATYTQPTGFLAATFPTAVASWASATRTLTAGDNIVLAKGVGVTGFNDITAADVWTASPIGNDGGGNAFATLGPAGQASVLAAVGMTTGNLDAQLAALPTASENASAVWAFVCEGAITAVEILRGILSFIGGQTLGGNTTNPRFRDQANTKNRIDMTVDSAGNRTATTLDLS